MQGVYKARGTSKETNDSISIPVTEIWIELSEPKRAIAAALRAHNSACGSGEPYVHSYYLSRANALLRKLGVTPPKIPRDDRSNDEVYEWEGNILTLIKKMRESAT